MPLRTEPAARTRCRMRTDVSCAIAHANGSWGYSGAAAEARRRRCSSCRPSPAARHSRRGSRMVRLPPCRLYAEGADSGRVMCIALHPYVVGQPHRIKHLDDILSYVLAHDGVWQTTADEIAEYYLEHAYDAAVAHATALEA